MPVVGDLTVLVNAENVSCDKVYVLSTTLKLSKSPGKVSGKTKIGNHPVLHNDLLQYIAMKIGHGFCELPEGEEWTIRALWSPGREIAVCKRRRYHAGKQRGVARIPERIETVGRINQHLPLCPLKISGHNQHIRLAEL